MEQTEEKDLFHKFPRTRHLLDGGGGVGRDDLLMDKKDVKNFLTNHIYVEEKVDGANLGISITENYQLTFQNRSHYVNSASATQWKALDLWASQHSELLSVLTPQLIIFGEWLYAKHSIHYTNLPGYFIAFDVWNKEENKFLSRKERDKLLKGTGIPSVPLIAEGKFKPEDLKALLKSKSKFYDGPVEGVYLRIDEEPFLKERAKIVRGDFLQTNEDGITEHWSKSSLVKNIVKFE